MARVTFSFDTWKDADVAPSTIELPVVAADATPAADAVTKLEKEQRS